MIQLLGLATAALCLVAAGSAIGLFFTLLREFPLWVLLVLVGTVVLLGGAA